MNVPFKVIYQPGVDRADIMVIPPKPMTPFFAPTTQVELQALANDGALWGDDEARIVGQAFVDASEMYGAWGFVLTVASE